MSSDERVRLLKAVETALAFTLPDSETIPAATCDSASVLGFALGYLVSSIQTICGSAVDE